MPLNDTIDPNQYPWDPKRLKIVASSLEEEQAVLAMLLRQGEQAIAIMEKSCGNEKVAQWRKAAHTLRGSASNLGMEKLAGYCREDEESTSFYEARTLLMGNIKQELKRIKQHKELQVLL
jgi:hypothetical protein